MKTRKIMKKLLFLFLSISFLAVSCTKDEEPAKPIDKFVKTFTGSFYEYSCDASPVILQTLENTKVEISKQNDTDLSGKIKDGSGNSIFTFTGKLDENNDNAFRIPNFIYNSDTLFGGGEMSAGKLKIQFAAKSCPAAAANTFRVTREFKEE